MAKLAKETDIPNVVVRKNSSTEEECTEMMEIEMGLSLDDNDTSNTQSYEEYNTRSKKIKKIGK